MNNSVTITRHEPEKWVPVWWNRLLYGGRVQRVKAIAGNPSHTGKTVRVRAHFDGGMVERNIKPENLEPR